MTVKKGASRVSASMAAVLPDTRPGRSAVGQRRSSAGVICRARFWCQTFLEVGLRVQGIPVLGSRDPAAICCNLPCHYER